MGRRPHQCWRDRHRRRRANSHKQCGCRRSERGRCHERQQFEHGWRSRDGWCHERQQFEREWRSRDGWRVGPWWCHRTRGSRWRRWSSRNWWQFYRRSNRDRRCPHDWWSWCRGCGNDHRVVQSRRGAQSRRGKSMQPVEPLQLAAHRRCRFRPSLWAGIMVARSRAPASSSVARNAHSCAVLSNGTLKCWGRKAYAQLGDGSTASRSNPITVGITAQSIGLGDGDTCAIISDGSTKCWGDDGFGELNYDIPSSPTYLSSPVATKDFTSTKAAAVFGGGFGCAITVDHSVKCWGGNERTEFGRGTLSATEVGSALVQGL